MDQRGSSWSIERGPGVLVHGARLADLGENDITWNGLRRILTQAFRGAMTHFVRYIGCMAELRFGEPSLSRTGCRRMRATPGPGDSGSRLIGGLDHATTAPPVLVTDARPTDGSSRSRPVRGGHAATIATEVPRRPVAWRVGRLRFRRNGRCRPGCPPSSFSPARFRAPVQEGRRSVSGSWTSFVAISFILAALAVRPARVGRCPAAGGPNRRGRSARRPRDLRPRPAIPRRLPIRRRHLGRRQAGAEA